MFNRDSLTQALFFVLLANLSIMGYQYYYGSPVELSVIQPMPQELMVKAPTPGKNKFIKVETDVLTFWIDKQGGRISKALIAGTDEPFFNMDGAGYLDAQTGFTGDAQLTFSSSKSHYTLDGKSLTVTLTATDSNGLAFQKRFEFTRGEYAVKVKSSVINQSDKPVVVQNYNVIGGDRLTERGAKAPSAKELSFESKSGNSLAVRDYNGISYTTNKKPYVRMKFNKMKGAKTEKTKGGWVSFQKHHFIAAWVLDKDTNYRVNNFWTEGLSSKNRELYEQQFATQAVSAAETLNPGKSTSQTTTLYVGEQSVPKMMAVDPSLRLTMDYGFFWMVSNVLHKCLRFIHDYIPNWSLSLVFLVALVRLAMFPSMKQQLLQTQKMKAMAPEKEIIEKRYEKDKWNPQRFEALSELHKKHGINTMSITMLIPLLQIPLMIAFFNMVQVAVEFRTESFLWITDMSQRDPYYIMPVLASLMMVLHFSTQKDNGMNEDFKMIFRVMPLVMLFISFKWPAVICLYLVTNTMLFALQDIVSSKK